MLQFGIAKELGKSLAEVRQMTLEEILGWSAYFQILNEDQQKEIDRAKRLRQTVAQCLYLKTVAYQADINVKVKGANEVTRLSKKLDKASTKIDAFNKKSRLIVYFFVLILY